MTQHLKIVPSSVTVTSNVTGTKFVQLFWRKVAYFQALRHVITPAALMVRQ